MKKKMEEGKGKGKMERALPDHKQQRERTLSLLRGEKGSKGAKRREDRRREKGGGAKIALRNPSTINEGKTQTKWEPQRTKELNRNKQRGEGNWQRKWLFLPKIE